MENEKEHLKEYAKGGFVESKPIDRNNYNCDYPMPTSYLDSLKNKDLEKLYKQEYLGNWDLNNGNK